MVKFNNSVDMATLGGNSGPETEAKAYEINTQNTTTTQVNNLLISKGQSTDSIIFKSFKNIHSPPKHSSINSQENKVSNMTLGLDSQKSQIQRHFTSKSSDSLHAFNKLLDSTTKSLYIYKRICLFPLLSPSR